MEALAFDLEIAKLIPEGETNWEKHMPLGITCMAAASKSELWTWQAQYDGIFSSQMKQNHCKEVVNFLIQSVRKGYTLLTWNGLSFDFRVLAQESGLYIECQELAINHVDMMFHFFCSKGFAIGLDAASKGLGLPGKPEGVSGAKAPEMWANGQQKEVIAYVESDARQTLEVFQKSQSLSGVTIPWIARSGRANKWHAQKWLSVSKARKLPTPDNSWMDDPWQRSKFYGWTEEPSQLFGE